MKEKEEGLCVTCGKYKELSWMKQFDECIDCAENLENKLLTELLSSFSLKQMVLWEEYNKAKELVKSMRILDY